MDGDKEQPVPDGGDEARWRYASDGAQPADSPPPHVGDGAVEWTASEFVAHSKGAGWYVMLALSAAVLAVGVYWMTRDRLSVAVIILVALLLGISAARQPRVLQYAVNDDGLTIGGKFYSFADFKSFALVEEGAFFSILFMPLKRFMPPITVYYDPNDEDRVIKVLSRSLPMENRRHDAIDQLIRRIRF